MFWSVCLCSQASLFRLERVLLLRPSSGAHKFATRTRRHLPFHGVKLYESRDPLDPSRCVCIRAFLLVILGARASNMKVPPVVCIWDMSGFASGRTAFVVRRCGAC